MCHDSWVSCRCNPHPNPFLWRDHRRCWFVQRCETLLCFSWQWGNCPVSFTLVCTSGLLFVLCAIFMWHFFPFSPAKMMIDYFTSLPKNWSMLSKKQRKRWFMEHSTTFHIHKYAHTHIQKEWSIWSVWVFFFKFAGSEYKSYHPGEPPQSFGRNLHLWRDDQLSKLCQEVILLNVLPKL